MKTDVEYWDGIFEQTKCKNEFRDNFFKRRRLISQLLKYEFEDSAILELGVGLGVTASILRLCYGGNFKYIGIDISKKFCDFANSQWGLTTYCCRAFDTHLKSKFFNVVFAFDVLEHIPDEEKMPVFKELDRVMTDKAYMFINNPCSHNPNFHDKNFEHNFTEKDLGNLCETINASVLEVVNLDGLNGGNYQFIVLKKKEHGK